LCTNHSFSLLNQPINLFTDSNKVLIEKQFKESHRLLHIKFNKGSYKPELLKVGDINYDPIKIYKFSSGDPLPVQTLTEFLNDLKKFKDIALTEFTPVFSLGNVTFDLDTFSQNVTYPLNGGKFPCKIEEFPSVPFNFIALMSTPKSSLTVPVSTMIRWLTPIAEKFPNIWVIFDCNIFEIYSNDLTTLSHVRDSQYFVNSQVNGFSKMMTSLSNLVDPNADAIIEIVKDNFCVSNIDKLTLVVLCNGDFKKVETIKNLKSHQIRLLGNYLHYEHHQDGPVSIYLGKSVKQVFVNTLLPETKSPPEPNFCFTVQSLQEFLQTYDDDDFILLNSESRTKEYMTFDGPANTSFGPNVINYPECKLTEINTIGRVLKYLTSIRCDTNQPVLCNGKPFYLIQRLLDGKAFLIPIFDETTDTIAKTCINPLARLNKLINDTNDGDLLIKLAQEVSKFNHSLFTQAIQIVKIHTTYYTMEEFVNIVAPVMKDSKCLKIFKSACNKKVHSSSHHYYKLYTFIGRNPEMLIRIYKRMTQN
jgi:hypothetical protein